MVIHSFRRLRAAAFFLSFASAASAQPALSLPQAQRVAVARSHQLAAKDAAAAALRERAAAVGQLPDPVLTLGVENLPVTGPDRLSLTRDFMTMRRIGVMQDLPSARKRRLRVERVERDGERVQAERSLARAAIERDTALSWIDRHEAQATLALLRLQAQETRLQVQGAHSAYRGGRGSAADLLGGRAALAQVEDRLRQAEQQERSAALMLARWVGPAAAAQPLAGPPDWRQSPLPDTPDPAHLRGHPQLGAVAAQVRAAETDVAQAEADRRPDWTVEASYSQRGAPYPSMVSLGVSVPLQLDRGRRQDRETAARRAALAQARAEYEDALSAYEAEVAVARGDWSASRERAARLAAELLPAAAQRAEAALAAYRAGQADLASALAARRDEIDARLQVLAIEMETARLWAGLNFFAAGAGETLAKEQP